MRKRREAAVMSRKVKVMICFFILFITAEFFVTASRTDCIVHPYTHTSPPEADLPPADTSHCWIF